MTSLYLIIIQCNLCGIYFLMSLNQKYLAQAFAWHFTDAATESGSFRDPSYDPFDCLSSGTPAGGVPTESLRLDLLRSGPVGTQRTKRAMLRSVRNREISKSNRRLTESDKPGVSMVDRMNRRETGSCSLHLC